MRGSTQKRCPCPPRYDATGKKKACPKRHGSWYYVLDIGAEPVTGKRRQSRQGGFKTQADAEKALSDSLNRVRTGLHRHDNNPTIASYLEGWMADKEVSLEATTLKEYRRHVRVHLNPHLGSTRLRDLRPRQVSEVLRTLIDSGSGVTTVQRVHAPLRSAMTDAVRAELILSNPATHAVAPRQQRPKISPWEPEELGTFLNYASNDDFSAVFELIAAGGLRRGEALGLRWEDVDLVNGVLTVQQQIVQLDKDRDKDRGDALCPVCGQEHRGRMLTAPKTASGTARKVDLGQQAIGVLLAHRLAQDAARAEWGSAYADHGLVFATPGGDPHRPDRVTKRFEQLVKSSGLRPTRLHDLRHARASLLLASGTDLAGVQDAGALLDLDHRRHLLTPPRGRRSARSRSGRRAHASPVTNR